MRAYSSAASSAVMKRPIYRCLSKTRETTFDYFVAIIVPEHVRTFKARGSRGNLPSQTHGTETPHLRISAVPVQLSLQDSVLYF